MAQTSAARAERTNLRLSGTAKQRIEWAASVEGKTVSAFILASALEHADRTIDRHEAIVLACGDAVRRNLSTPLRQHGLSFSEHLPR